jgi:hypothetical protein
VNLEEADINIHLNGPEGTMCLELSDGTLRKEFTLTYDEQLHVLRLLAALHARVFSA